MSSGTLQSRPASSSSATRTSSTARADGGRDLRQQRLQSLDAYRGLIMVTLAFAGFGLAGTATKMLERDSGNALWSQVHYQFSHVEWTGCGYWDLIQPSFMFMVGLSMAYSYARRAEQGHSYARMLAHAVWRSLVLILLGIFLISNWNDATNWSLMNVLTQIGLGYAFLFLLWRRPLTVQAVAAVAILFGTWLLYVTYPHAGLDLSQGAPEVGVSAEWARQHLENVSPAWHKNANVGHAIDVWLLNQLPTTEPFVYNQGGYQTINFIPSLATMLFGLMAGELLRNRWNSARKLGVLVAAAAAGLAIGWLLHISGICPLVKRIWTPSWALFSTGWCLLILASLYLVIDVIRLRWLAFPLVVVGMNSIAIYVMSMLLKPWTTGMLKTHLGPEIFQLKLRWGTQTWRLLPAINDANIALWEPTLQAVLVGLFFWLICFWMYRQRIFIRI